VAALEELRVEFARERDAAAPPPGASDDEVTRKLSAVHEHLDQARQELEIERRKRITIEEELRIQVGLERQLRQALAGQEAEAAAAQAQVARRVRAAERRRESEERVDPGQPHEVDDDFFTRLEEAKRVSETGS